MLEDVPRPMPEPDEYWVERARQDPQAYEQLVRRYQNRLYSLACRLTGDAEESRDLVQEGFLRAYLALPDFRRGARFSPWIYRIVVNLCINHLRRRREEIRYDPEWAVADSSPTPQEVVERLETQMIVQKAILELPERYRVALLLRHQQGLSYEEIAQVLGLPVGTVKTHLFRARAMLHSILSQDVEPTERGQETP
jgi:RNA polymerase sigma-70 factor (ECF subfamily)